MTTQPQFESRQDCRTWLSVPVTVLIAGRDEALVKTANISMGGLFVPLLNPPSVGTLVRFTLELDPRPVRGFSEVVWVRQAAKSLDRPAGMGLKIRHFLDDGEAVLREALGRSRRPLPA